VATTALIVLAVVPTAAGPGPRLPSRRAV